MLPILNVNQIRNREAVADSSGLPYAEMMQRAGRALAARTLTYLSAIDQPRVTVLVGAGNNGGDGLVAARVLAQENGVRVRCYLLKARPDDLLVETARKVGVLVALAADDRDGRVLRNMVASADVVLDALFGIGVKLPLREDAAKVLRQVHAALREQSQPEGAQERLILPDQPAPSGWRRPIVIAVDCPSGLDCDNGQLDVGALPADETVTFISAKPGLFLFPGAAAVGRLSVATLGVSVPLAAEMVFPMLVDADAARARLPERPVNSSKGTFGKAMVVAGCERYVGAVGLASMSAYRVGAGLVTAVAPAALVAALSGTVAEPTWLPLAGDGALRADTVRQGLPGYTAALIGPGLGTAPEARDLVYGLLGEGREALPPLILDADALNLLSVTPEWWRLLPPETILTPHPGEMGRLCGLTTEAVQADRWGIAARKAAEWQAIVVLKGAHTVIAAPDGRLAVLPFKTDALAKAGTGDVLAGMVVGLRAQGSTAFDAAVAAAYLHGLAGELAAAQVGSRRAVVARNVRDQIGAALRAVSR
jgi:NAD(P)H-hydrate epimerase